MKPLSNLFFGLYGSDPTQLYVELQTSCKNANIELTGTKATQSYRAPYVLKGRPPSFLFSSSFFRVVSRLDPDMSRTLGLVQLNTMISTNILYTNGSFAV